MPFLSLIIPVYNVEAYLCQCVNSVLDQQLEDFELILIDDGSKDLCSKLCEEYMARFSQVCVIHQRNKGLSAARNIGLYMAHGEYVIFMDSDDWWNPEVSVRKMLTTVREKPNVDIFLFSGLDYVEGKGFFERSDTVRRLGRNSYNESTYYKVMLATGNLQVSAATKILKTTFLQENKLEFQSGLKGEDNEWMIRLLRCKSSIVILPDPLYICRLRRSDSITNSINKSNVSDLLQIVQASITYYKSPYVNRSVMKYEFCFCAYLWFCALGLSWNLKPDERVELFPDFIDTASVCKYSKSNKTRFAYLVYSVFGMKTATIVLGGYINLKNKFLLKKKRVS